MKMQYVTPQLAIYAIKPNHQLMTISLEVDTEKTYGGEEGLSREFNYDDDEDIE